MRKIWLLAVSFLIFLSSTSLVLDLFSFNVSFAKEITQEVAVSNSAQKVNYELPYPGLLPDSPLYLFKVARDKIVNFLISDPLKKAEFNLLQADKRLNAGIYLFNKGKTSLSLSTVSKAENYFEQALNKVEEAKMQGKNISEMEEKLKNAFKKHRQELGYLTQKTSANFIAGFEKEGKRLVGFDRRLNH